MLKSGSSSLDGEPLRGGGDPSARCFGEFVPLLPPAGDDCPLPSSLPWRDTGGLASYVNCLSPN